MKGILFLPAITGLRTERLTVMRGDVIDAPIGNDIHQVQVMIFVYVFTLSKMPCSLQLASEYQLMDLFYIQLGGPASDAPKRCCRQEF